MHIAYLQGYQQGLVKIGFFDADVADILVKAGANAAGVVKNVVKNVGKAKAPFAKAAPQAVQKVPAAGGGAAAGATGATEAEIRQALAAGHAERQGLQASLKGFTESKPMQWFAGREPWQQAAMLGGGAAGLGGLGYGLGHAGGDR